MFIPYVQSDELTKFHFQQDEYDLTLAGECTRAPVPIAIPACVIWLKQQIYPRLYPNNLSRVTASVDDLTSEYKM